MWHQHNRIKVTLETLFDDIQIGGDCVASSGVAFWSQDSWKSAASSVGSRAIRGLRWGLQWYHHHYVKIGPVCKKVQTFHYNNVLYIRTDRKEKFWVQNSWWFRANKLSSQYFTERTSVIECAIVQKYLVLILLTTHLLSSSSVWSESSSSRSQNSEFESSSEYSLGGEGGSQLKSYNKVKLKYSEWYLDQRKTTQALD